MPIPWLAALKLVPWSSLLVNAPAIARAADNLLSGAKAHREGTSGAADEFRQLSQRVWELERQNRAHAELGKQMSDQIEALTLATEVLAVRQRWFAVTAMACFLSLLIIVLTRG